MLLQASTCLALLTAAARATIVHIDGNGPQAQNNPEQSRKATFVNQLSAGDCNLYWVGAFKSGSRLFYRPLAAKGGERTIEGFPGQVFALTAREPTKRSPSTQSRTAVVAAASASL